MRRHGTPPPPRSLAGDTASQCGRAAAAHRPGVLSSQLSRHARPLSGRGDRPAPGSLLHRGDRHGTGPSFHVCLPLPSGVPRSSPRPATRERRPMGRGPQGRGLGGEPVDADWVCSQSSRASAASATLVAVERGRVTRWPSCPPGVSRIANSQACRRPLTAPLGGPIRLRMTRKSVSAQNLRLGGHAISQTVRETGR